MSNANATASATAGGIGFPGLLTILFIALKLTGQIDWSWIWVLSPIWISWAIALGIFLVFGLMFMLAAIFGKR